MKDELIEKRKIHVKNESARFFKSPTTVVIELHIDDREKSYGAYVLVYDTAGYGWFAKKSIMTSAEDEFTEFIQTNAESGVSYADFYEFFTNHEYHVDFLLH